MDCQLYFSCVPITLQRPQFPQLFSRSVRERETNLGRLMLLKRWLLNWNGKMSSVLLRKDWDNKTENPPLPNREFLTDTGNPCITSELFKYCSGGCISITDLSLTG